MGTDLGLGADPRGADSGMTDGEAHPRRDAHEGLLDGVRVLDLSIWRPGPYATQLLAEVGAEVIKVEPPGGDPMRAYAGLFAQLHAGKRSVELDLKSVDGQARALELAAEADVVIEGFRPGVAARLGVGYEQVRDVNSSIIYCSVSGFGQSGPLVDVPGHDLNYTAWAGVLSPDRSSPAVPAIPVADLSGGMAAAFAICAAMVRRQRTGDGERIDVAMTDVLATWTGVVAPAAEGIDPNRRGLPGYGVFATSDDRYIALGVVAEDHFWRPLCDTLGLSEVADLRFVDRAVRTNELNQRIAERVRTRTRDALVADLLAADVPVAPVLDRNEMAALEHLRTRGVVVTDPASGLATGHPIRFDHHPPAPRTPAPTLDQHRGAGFSPRPR